MQCREVLAVIEDNGDDALLGQLRRQAGDGVRLACPALAEDQDVRVGRADDVAAIEVKPLVKGKTVAVQLTDFSVYYSQDSAKAAAESLKEKASKIVVENAFPLLDLLRPPLWTDSERQPVSSMVAMLLRS